MADSMPYQQVQQHSPLGETNWSGNNVTTTYDPRILNDLWAQTDLRQNQRNVYGIAADNAYRAMTGPGADPRSGLPALAGDVNPNGVQYGYSRAGFTPIPGANGFGAERQRVEDALYGNFASRADQRFGLDETALRNRLRDQGFVAGDEGYNTELGLFNQGKNDAYQQAMFDARTGAGAEQSRMLADALRIRQQQGGESQQDLSNYNQGGAQDFSQRLASGAFRNQTRAQGFGENQGANNQTRDWLSLAQQGAPQGTMLPNFDLGLRGIDEDQASRNAWLAGLSPFINSLLTGGGTQGGGLAGSLGGLIGQIPGWIASLGGGGSQANWGSGSNPDWGMGNRDSDWIEPPPQFSFDDMWNVDGGV